MTTNAVKGFSASYSVHEVWVFDDKDTSIRIYEEITLLIFLMALSVSVLCIDGKQKTDQRASKAKQNNLVVSSMKWRQEILLIMSPKEHNFRKKNIKRNKSVFLSRLEPCSENEIVIEIQQRWPNVSTCFYNL